MLECAVLADHADDCTCVMGAFATVVAVMAKVMLHPQIGPIAQILQKLGSDIVFDPLGNPDTALLTIILTNVYMYMPLFIFLSFASRLAGN